MVALDTPTAGSSFEVESAARRDCEKPSRDERFTVKGLLDFQVELLEFLRRVELGHLDELP